MNIQKQYGNFRLKNKNTIKSRGTTAYTFVHEKLGTEVVYLETDYPEFFYAIGFNTPALDDRGLTHILEHCVLAGSENFPAKDPFVQLLKSAHQTFLNALTYPEFTVYPVGSTNETSFRKLMHVYTDAVFKPLVLRNEGIFLQEGWRFEKNEQGKYYLSGTVFNEMQGALATHERVFEEEYIAKIFKDTELANLSGGDPREIINLSYDDLVQYHHRYYHPSNAKIILRGSIQDIGWYLNFLDEEYLTDYKKSTPHKVNKQKRIRLVSQEVRMYSQEKTYSLGNAALLDVTNNMKQSLIADFVAYALGDNQEGLLTQYLSERALVESLDVYHETDLSQSVFVTRATVRKTVKRAQVRDAVTMFYHEVLKGVLHEHKLQVLWHNFYFKYMSSLENSGGFGVMNLIFSRWIAGLAPVHSLQIQEVMDELSREMSTEMILGFIDTYLIKNAHQVDLAVVPSRDKALSFDSVISAREKETNKHKETHNALNEKDALYQTYVNQTDPEEIIDLFKPVALKNLSVKQRRIAHKRHVYENVDIIETSDKSPLGYLKLAFLVSHLSPEEQLQYALYCQCVSEAVFDDDKDNDNYFAHRIASYNAHVTHVERKNNKFDSYIVLNFGYLKEKKTEAYKLIKEIGAGRFTLANRVVAKYYAQDLAALEQSFVDQGHVVAGFRSAAYHDAYAHAVDYSSGIAAFEYLKKDKKKILKKVVTECQISKLTLTCVAVNHSLDKKVLHDFNRKSKRKFKVTTLDVTTAEHVMNGVPVSYNGLSWKTKLGQDDIAIGKLISGIASLDYLWREVREKGGAYGAGMRVSGCGLSQMISYRDSRTNRTFDVFKDTHKHLQDTIDNMNLHGYKVRVFGELDAPLSPKDTVSQLLAWKLKGIDESYFNKIRRDLKQMSNDDLKKALPKIFKNQNQAIPVTIGNGVGYKYSKKTKI